MIERELLREQWSTVANVLSINFIAPFFLSLPDGAQCEFACLLPQFGGERGMLIDTEHSATAHAAAMASGYGVSSMGAEHHHLPINAADYIECLVDWTWVGPGPAPEWYTSAA